MKFTSMEGRRKRTKVFEDIFGVSLYETISGNHAGEKPKQ